MPATRKQKKLVSTPISQPPSPLPSTPPLFQPPNFSHIPIINQYFNDTDIWDQGDFHEWCRKSNHPKLTNRASNQNYWLNSLKNRLSDDPFARVLFEQSQKKKPQVGPPLSISL